MLAGSADKKLSCWVSPACWTCMPCLPHQALPCLPVQVQDDDVYMVLNAGCAEKDLEHMERQDEVFKVNPGWAMSQL